METQEVLQNCTVEGNIVKLPAGNLDRALYLAVAKALNLIGGKWKGGKVAGFVFPSDPTELLEQIANGKKRNLKKEFQFFATPAPLADKLVEYAEPNETHCILEPSAGQGAIIDAIQRKLPFVIVDYCELMDTNRLILAKKSKLVQVGQDFLMLKNCSYDRIIANPPFSQNQDIDHVYHMFKCLKPGGRIVSVMSKHWNTSTNKKETEFREWLNTQYHLIEDVDAGTFKESGTNIATQIVIIDKK